MAVIINERESLHNSHAGVDSVIDDSIMITSYISRWLLCKTYIAYYNTFLFHLSVSYNETMRIAFGHDKNFNKR